MSGHLARDGGLLVRIADAGIGVPGDRLEQLNVQLAHPPAADGAVTRHMGLFAVAHLAARHGITVVLAQPPDGGTTAEVHLPAGPDFAGRHAGLAPRPGPGWRGAPDRAGGGAGAADPLFVAPRFAAGPEAAPGPEHGTPAGGQPIFESVESEYPHARDGSRLRRAATAGRGAAAPAGQAPRGAGGRGAGGRGPAGAPATGPAAPIRAHARPRRRPSRTRVRSSVPGVTKLPGVTTS